MRRTAIHPSNRTVSTLQTAAGHSIVLIYVTRGGLLCTRARLMRPNEYCCVNVSAHPTSSVAFPPPKRPQRCAFLRESFNVIIIGQPLFASSARPFLILFKHFLTLSVYGFWVVLADRENRDRPHKRIRVSLHTDIVSVYPAHECKKASSRRRHECILGLLGVFRHVWVVHIRKVQKDLKIYLCFSKIVFVLNILSNWWSNRLSSSHFPGQFADSKVYKKAAKCDKQIHIYKRSRKLIWTMCW